MFLPLSKSLAVKHRSSVLSPKFDLMINSRSGKLDGIEFGIDEGKLVGCGDGKLLGKDEGRLLGCRDGTLLEIN